MLRVINVGERNIYPGGAKPVTVAAATSTPIFPDQTVEPKMQEIAYRYVQNVTGADLYYAFGQQCDTSNFHGVLVDKAQLDCSNHRLSVSVYSAAGGTVAQCILFRNDQGRNNSFATEEFPS
jgi:hypothetical protein